MALGQVRLDSLLPDNLLLGFIKHDLLMSPATLVGTLFGVPFFVSTIMASNVVSLPAVSTRIRVRG